MEKFNFLGPEAEFEHIGLAVGKIEDVSAALKPIVDPIQKVKIAFLNLNGIKIELVAPNAEDSPVNGILEKKQTLYHLCYKVPDINVAIQEGKKSGFHCIATPVPAVAFDNKRIAWLYNRFFGLVEIVEK